MSNSFATHDCSLQAPLFMEFSRQEYWSRLPFPSPEDLPDPGIKPVSLTSLALAARFFYHCATWETQVRSLGQEDPLEKEMATCSSTLAWKIPWMASLVGYSPWGHKESDTTERHLFTLLKPIGLGLSCFHFHLFLCIFWFPFLFLLWSVGYSEMCCLSSLCLYFNSFFPL